MHYAVHYLDHAGEVFGPLRGTQSIAWGSEDIDRERSQLLLAWLERVNRFEIGGEAG